MMRLLAPIKRWSSRFGLVRIKSFWLSLTFPQRCYFSALMICLNGLFVDLPVMDETPPTFSNPFINFALFIALIALVVEFWPRFYHFWESLPGKAIILLFYAFVANYALVQAAGMINDITGLNADKFPYSHNMALLLSIPSWFAITTLFVLLITQLAMPLYLLALLILRPLGVHEYFHSPDYRFPFITGIVRYGFSLTLLAAAVTMTQESGLSTSINETLSGIARGFDGVIDVNNEDAPQDAETEEPLGISLDVQVQSEDAPTPLQENVSVNQSKLDKVRERNSKIRQKGQAYDQHIKQFIANFVYFQEADEKSRCEHDTQSRIVELNDFEIVEIFRDSTQPLRYRYEVKPCISAALGHQFKQPK